MSFFRRTVFVCLLGLLALWPAAGSAAEQPSVHVAVEDISLASINSERLQLNARVSIVSSRNVTLREITFDRLRVNGLPFYASPISENLALAANQKVEPQKPVSLTVYFRDLTGVRPIRAFVQEGKLTVNGTAYADVRIGPATKVVLLTSRVRVPVPVDTTTELRFPVPALGRHAALALLDGVQAALDRMNPQLRTVAGMVSPRQKLLWEQYAPSLVLAHATYSLRDEAGTAFNFEAIATGFRFGGNRVLLPKSVVEPWKFDPYVAASMAQDQALKVADYDLWIWPADAPLRDEKDQLLPAQAWRLSAKQLRLTPAPKDDFETLFVPNAEGKPQKVRVHRRQSASALALAEILEASPDSSDSLFAASPATSGAPVALFRFPQGVEARKAQPDLVTNSLRQSAGRLQLDSPIDSFAWGSPVIAEGGVVGIVVGETSMVPIGDAAKMLKFNLDEGKAKGEKQP
jgi:hypothetical protein